MTWWIDVEHVLTEPSHAHKDFSEEVVDGCTIAFLVENKLTTCYRVEASSRKQAEELAHYMDADLMKRVRRLYA